MVELQATTTTGTYLALQEIAVSEFRASLGGDLIVPGDAGYGEARKVWNANVDKHPALIARCAGVSDVINSVNFARDNNLLVSIRGGGHSFPGTCVAEGGLVIDLSLMNSVRVDPARRTARAEGGAKWGQFDRETQAFGLAATGGTNSDTGIAGLTLGGGMGWLGGKHGLACDNLVSVDVVTSFEYQLYPVSSLLAGLVFYPFDKAKDVLRFYHEFASAAPDELNTAGALLHLPDGIPAAAIGICYNGPINEGEKAIQSLRQIAPPLVEQIGPLTYQQAQHMVDAATPEGNQYYEKAHYFRDISDGAIDTLIEHFTNVPSPLSLPFFQQLGNAANRVSPQETAFSHRDALYNLILIADWTDPGESEIHVKWIRDLWDALQPYSTGGVYVNNIGREADGDGHLIRAAYGSNYPRLAEIKTKYDPANFFRHNQNIKPAG